MTSSSHAIVASAQDHTLQLSLADLRLFARADPNELAEYIGRDRFSRDAVLVHLVSTRNEKLAEAASDAGFPAKFKGMISEKVFVFLWTQAHDDLMWLYEQGPEWQQAMSMNMPWKFLLAERVHRPEWDASLATLLAHWPASRLSKYPHALKYMTNPSEQHVLTAACHPTQRYMKAEQIDALRPGASQWFKTRKSLGLDETPGQLTYAFRAWWNQGRVQDLEGLNTDVFSASDDSSPTTDA